MQNTGYYTEFLIIILILVALAVIYYYTRRYRKPTKTANNYLAALEYLVDGDHRRSIQKFKEAVHEDTENINAYLRLGDLLRSRGGANSALRIHKDLMLRSGLTEEFKTRVRHSLLLDYETMGDMEHAAEIADAILKNENLYYRETATKLVTYLEKKQNWDAAFQASKNYFKPLTPPLKKKMALYLVFQGLELINNDEGKESRLKFKEALKLDNECSAAYFYLGKSYYLEDRLEDAVHQWQELCRKVPQQAHIVFDSLERAWFELGKFTEAEKLYSDLLTTNAENIAAAISLAEIYSKKGEYDRALEILDRMDTIKANDARLVSFRIQVLYNKNQYKTATSRAIDFLEAKNYLPGRRYICQECQFKGTEPLWICPQCKSINSFNL